MPLPRTGGRRGESPGGSDGEDGRMIQRPRVYVWLGRLGIEARAAALKAHATPREAAGIEAALIRLTAPVQMGTLFKALALSARGWPVPAGFAA